MGVSLSLPIILSKKGLIYFEFTNIFLEALFKSFSEQPYPLYMRVTPPPPPEKSCKQKNEIIWLVSANTNIKMEEPQCIWSVLKTLVKILPHKAYARLIRTK